MAYVFVKDGFVPEEEAAVSVKERGFRFGDGVFETVLVQDGIAYQWDLHEARLRRGAEALRIPTDDIGSVEELCEQLIAMNGFRNGFLRISLSRGIGSKGYLPACVYPMPVGGVAQPRMEPTLVIETLPWTEPPGEAVSLWLSTYRKPSPRSLPVQMKLMQGVNSTLARMEAVDNHCFEALLLGEDGQVCEGSSANIFWYKNGVLYTPSQECGVLMGTTREAIIQLSPFPIEEGIFSLRALRESEEVFICNVAWGALPVKEMQPLGYSWEKPEYEITNAVNTVLKNDIRAYVAYEAQRRAKVGQEV